MATVAYETENAVFQFDLNDTVYCLENCSQEHSATDTDEILKFIKSSPDESITIIDDYFGYIVLDLTEKGKGLVKCKTCSKVYAPDQIESITVGHGKTPFLINLKEKGGIIKRLFGRKQKLPGMFGGKGYQCPEGHELIAMITWRT